MVMMLLQKSFFPQHVQSCRSGQQGPDTARPLAQQRAPATRQRHTQGRAVALDELQLIADAAVSGISPAALVVPGVAAVLAGAAALKFYLYSQLEVITAKMLSKYVPSGDSTGARVIQLGGGTRELYYYPKDVVLVVNVGEKVNKGLMEQAGVTAAVPTQVKQQPITDLSFQPDSSIDAVVSLNQLSDLEPQQLQQCLREISRVLKPGMPLVFVEPVAEGGSPLRGLVGVSPGKQLSASQLDLWQQNPAFSYVQWDTALGGQDPHAVGVAVRSEVRVSAKGTKEDEPSARRRRKQPKAAKGFS